MSLYEKYFSKINENHMYQLIKNIILEEKGINIETNNYYHKIFKDRYPLIFYENDKETLVEFNKILIDDICNLVIHTNITTDSNTIETTIEETINPGPIKQVIEEKEYGVFQSSKRNKGSFNRFNYKIWFDRKRLRIDKLIIPYEDNILFITNDLVLKINNYNIYLNLTSKDKINSREYLTFEPMDKQWLNITEKELEIKIMDELDREIKDTDIFDIESIKNVSLKSKEYMCIHCKNSSNLTDIITGDKLGLMNNDSIIDITKVVFKTDKYLLCNLLTDDKYDYDQLINLSLQNKIYCEKS